MPEAPARPNTRVAPLPASCCLGCRSRCRGEAKELARLLSENPGFSKTDVEDAVEFFKQVVDKKVAADHDFRKEFPGMDYKQARG